MDVQTVAPDRREVARHVEGLSLALLMGAKSCVGQGLVRVERAGHRLGVGLPDISRHQERIVSLLRHAAGAVARGVEQRTERVNGFSNQLRSLDPRGTLARGYAVVQLREGKQAITSIRQVKGKDRLDVHVKDGKFPAEVSRQYGF